MKLKTPFKIALGTLISSASLLSGADPLASEKEKDKPVQIEAIQVTGTYLPYAAEVAANPVISISIEDLENVASRTNIGDALRRQVPQFNGNGNIGTSNANIGAGSTNGGSQIALRNANTLVLFNGRRIVSAPVGAAGGNIFSDVNLVPFAAVSKIEILADGASAIYGSDAVSGVVNILFKEGFKGFEVGNRYAWTNNTGNATERSTYVIGGINEGKFQMTLSAEFSQQDPIYDYQRPYSATTYGTTSFAGSVNIGNNFYLLSPSVNSPTVIPSGTPVSTFVANGTYSGPITAGQQVRNFNLSQYVTQTIENERAGFVSTFSHKFDGGIKLFGDFLFVQTDTRSQINAQPLAWNFAAGANGNPFNEAVTARNRFLEHPRIYDTQTDAYRLVLGLNGEFENKWKWTLAGNFSIASQDFLARNLVNSEKLATAINDGTINFFARTQTPGAIESSGVLGTAYGEFLTYLTSFEYKTYGTIYKLPSGDVTVAVGAESRHETFKAKSDPLSRPDTDGESIWLDGSTINPFSASRDIYSFFSEVRAPILKNAPWAHYLELSAAARFENYSDNESPLIPKFSFLYLPANDNFSLRGTLSRSFVAPDLYLINGPITTGSSSPTTITPFNGSTPVESYQANVRTIPNRDLDPSRSQNYTFGFVVSPPGLKGLNFSMDYFRIKQKGIFSSISNGTILQDVETNGAASQYASQVKLGDYDGTAITAPGQVAGVPDNVYVTNSLLNLAIQDIQGFDVALDYEYELSKEETISLNNKIGIYTSYKSAAFAGDTPEDYAGTTSNFNGTLPRWQSYSSLGYSNRDWSFVTGLRYIPSIPGFDNSYRISHFYTVDLSVSYTVPEKSRFFNGFKFSFGVNNAFNRFGPLDPTINSDHNVDTGTYGAIGRQFFVNASCKF